MTPLRQAARPPRLLLIFAALSVLLLSQAAAVPFTPAVTADIIYGLVPANTLIRFSSASPGTINQTLPITGLLPGTSLVAIDFRPKTAQLYGIGITGTASSAYGRVYDINPATGAAALVGSSPFSTSLAAGASYGMDFNPLVDRIRLVNNLDINLRVNPSTGLLAAVDVSLHKVSGNPLVVALAYNRNLLGTGSSTLYGIDIESAQAQLVMVGGPNGNPSANGGVVSQVGPLGLTTQFPPNIGLDINTTGAAFASFRANSVFGLYSINLGSGGATLIGNIGTGATAIIDIAVKPRYYEFLPSAYR
jgi:uncharacterized protein DUF4394